MTKKQVIGLLAVALPLCAFPYLDMASAAPQQRGAAPQDAAGQAMENVGEEETADVDAAPPAKGVAPTAKPQADHLPPPNRRKSRRRTISSRRLRRISPSASRNTPLPGADVTRVELPEPDIPACRIPVPVDVSSLSVLEAVDLSPRCDARLRICLVLRRTGAGDGGASGEEPARIGTDGPACCRLLQLPTAQQSFFRARFPSMPRATRSISRAFGSPTVVSSRSPTGGRRRGGRRRFFGAFARRPASGFSPCSRRKATPIIRITCISTRDATARHAPTGSASNVTVYNGSARL